MQFPRTVYKTPGPHKASDGTTYDALIVDDEKALEDAVAKGWCRLRADLHKKPATAPQPDPVVEADDIRADVIAKMEKAGLKVDKRKSTEKLLSELEEG